MTRGTCEILCREVMNTGRIPAGNTRGRQLIPPTKQVLAFLWSMANEEPTRLIADRFNITMSSVNRVPQKGPGNGTILANGKGISQIPFRS